MKPLIAVVVALFVVSVIVSVRNSKIENARNEAIDLKLELERNLQSKVTAKIEAYKVLQSSVSIVVGKVKVGGVIDSAESRAKFEDEINAIEGLSLSPSDNYLTVSGIIGGERASGVFTVTGFTHNTEALMSSLVAPEGAPVIKGEGLTEADFYVDPPVVHNPEFKSWLASYMAPGGDRSFLLKGNTITLEGETTLKIEAELMKGLRILRLKVISKLEFYPSEINFPSYSYSSSSKLSSDELDLLNHELSLSNVLFESGVSQVDSRQIFKVDVAASVMLATGSRAKFVIGGHIDSTGDLAANQALSKKRVKSVLKLLNDRGVDTDQIEVVLFDAVEGAPRSVEIRVK